MNWDLIKLKLSGFRISARLIERIVIGSSTHCPGTGRWELMA